MSYMNHAEFAPAAGIQELSFDEINFVSAGGADPGVGQRAEGLMTLGNNMMAVGVGATVFSGPVGGAIGLWGAAVYLTGYAISVSVSAN
jgi:hypothetical protein